VILDAWNGAGLKETNLPVVLGAGGSFENRTGPRTIEPDLRLIIVGLDQFWTDFLQ
jgi:hypothetical protein